MRRRSMVALARVLVGVLLAGVCLDECIDLCSESCMCESRYAGGAYLNQIFPEENVEQPAEGDTVEVSRARGV